ncbi:MAG: hypothetical protein WCP85_03340 [Mariniphaga sp.]
MTTKKTIIAVVENDIPTETTFGAMLSKETGIPAFDIKSYYAKFGYPASGEKGKTQSWNNLLSDVRKQQNAILSNTDATELSLQTYQGFERKIVVFTTGDLNGLTFMELSHIAKNGIDPSEKKSIGLRSVARAEILARTKPDHIFNTWSKSPKEIAGNISKIVKS